MASIVGLEEQEERTGLQLRNGSSPDHLTHPPLQELLLSIHVGSTSRDQPHCPWCLACCRTRSVHLEIHVKMCMHTQVPRVISPGIEPLDSGLRVGEETVWQQTCMFLRRETFPGFMELLKFS